MNLYEQQAKNRRQTVVVMVCFAIFVAALGLGLDTFFLGTVGDGFFFPVGAVFGLALGTGSAFWSLNGGTRAVLASAGAVRADESIADQKQLLNVVDEMRIAAGLPMPQVYVIPDDDPNAFATGTSPEKSAVAVTSGLLSSLNREELQGVVAHEMAHIRNYDIRLMTVVAALVGTVLILSDMTLRSGRYGGGRRSSRSNSSGGSGPLMIIWLIAVILSPIIANLLAMMVSRKREYLADATGAELTRNPLALASALRKLENASDPTRSIKKGTAHLCIVDPTGRSLNEKEGKVADIFATHPPIARRIKLLMAMAYAGSEAR